jgi:hypothetical protein
MSTPRYRTIGPSDLAEQFVLWVALGVGTSFLVLCWPVLFDGKTFESVVSRGQLLLITLGHFSSALGYLAMANTRGGLRVVKSIVISGGLLLLMTAFGAYLKAVAGSTSARTGRVSNSVNVTSPSLRLFVSCVAIGAASVYIRYRAEKLGER